MDQATLRVRAVEAFQEQRRHQLAAEREYQIRLIEHSLASLDETVKCVLKCDAEHFLAFTTPSSHRFGAMVDGLVFVVLRDGFLSLVQRCGSCSRWLASYYCQSLADVGKALENWQEITDCRFCASPEDDQ